MRKVSQIGIRTGAQHPAPHIALLRWQCHLTPEPLGARYHTFTLRFVVFFFAAKTHVTEISADVLLAQSP
eukprot:scaffold29429_cov30-Tisochrysis_lutea.AAC.2